MKWVKTLIINKDVECLEKRIISILNYIIENYEYHDCLVSRIDATGISGNELTQKLNKIPVLQLDIKKFISILSDEGQVFEGKIEILSPVKLVIEITHGDIIDVYGEDDILPNSITGKHLDNDIKLFKPD